MQRNAPLLRRGALLIRGSMVHGRKLSPALRRSVKVAAPRPGHVASILKSARAALGLDVAAALFAFEPALFRSQRWPGGPSRNGARHGLAQEFDQTLDGIGAIALLGAEALRMNHDHAVLGQALAGEPGEARLGVRRQRYPAGIEPQLRSSRELVDVLAAGSRGAHEGDIDVVIIDCEVAGNPQHGVTEPGMIPDGNRSETR